MGNLIKTDRIHKMAKLHADLAVDMDQIHDLSCMCRTLDPGLLHRTDEACKILEGTGVYDLEVEAKDSHQVALTGGLEKTAVMFRIDMHDHTDVNLFMADASGDPEDVQPGDQTLMLANCLKKIRDAANDLLMNITRARTFPEDPLKAPAPEVEEVEEGSCCDECGSILR